MFYARTTNTIVPPEGAMVIETKANRPIINELKEIVINMVALPREMLYVLQDKVTVELWARESHAM